MSDLCADWETHGTDVLASVRTSSPGTYLRVVASIIPKDVHVQATTSEFAHLTDLQLVQMMEEEARFLLEHSDGSEQSASLKKGTSRCAAVK